MHIYVGKLTIIGSDNGLSPDRRQAIIWTNAGILLIGPFGTNLSEILIEIDAFSFKKMHLKMSSTKRWPFRPGLNLFLVLCVQFVSCGCNSRLDERLHFAGWYERISHLSNLFEILPRTRHWYFCTMCTILKGFDSGNRYYGRTRFHKMEFVGDVDPLLQKPPSSQLT